MKLDDMMEFSTEKTISKILHESEKVKSVFLCMNEGQTDLQESVDCKIAILVYSGCGSVFTNGEEQEIAEKDLVLFERDEPRTLKAKTKLTAVVTFINQ